MVKNRVFSSLMEQGRQGVVYHRNPLLRLYSFQASGVPVGCLSIFRKIPKIKILAFHLDEKWLPTCAREHPKIAPDGCRVEGSTRKELGFLPFVTIRTRKKPLTEHTTIVRPVWTERKPPLLVSS